MISTHDDGSVRWLTIDNPGRRNAVAADEWGVLADLIEDFAGSGQRALVLTGAGGDFCSGADLAGDMGSVESTGPGRHRSMLQLGRAARALHDLPKPTVAAVDGVAVGAGMNLALGCDVVIASEQARFSEIFVRRGLTLDFGGTWLLPRLVGLARARELALTGRMVGAEEALAIGMITSVVPSEFLAERAGETAALLAAGAPLAQRFIKAGIERSFEMTFDQTLAHEEQTQTICLTSEDVIEGVTAFLQKRDPEFKGR